MYKTVRLDQKDWDTVLEVLAIEADRLWDLYCDGDIDRDASNNLYRILEEMEPEVDR